MICVLFLIQMTFKGVEYLQDTVRIAISTETDLNSFRLSKGRFVICFANSKSLMRCMFLIWAKKTKQYFATKSKRV